MSAPGCSLLRLTGGFWPICACRIRGSRPVLSVTMYGMTLLPQDQPCRNDHAVGEMKWAPSK